MKKLIATSALLLLAGCATPADERAAAGKEAVALSKDCNLQPSYATRARCVATYILQADRKHGVNPRYDLQKIQAMIATAESVDKGAIAPQEANQRMSLYFAELDAAASADDAEAADRTRARYAAAAFSMQNGFQNASRSFQSAPTTSVPPYISPTRCMTQPSGGGFATSCNH